MALLLEARNGVQSSHAPPGNEHACCNYPENCGGFRIQIVIAAYRGARVCGAKVRKFSTAVKCCGPIFLEGSGCHLNIEHLGDRIIAVSYKV